MRGLADRWQGERLNSPNDAAVKSDGSIWFSDPDFGITSDYEGCRADSEIGANNGYRIDPDTGEVRLVADGFGTPNGVFDVQDDGTLSEGKVFADADADATSRPNARFDNLRFDDGGRLWVAAMGDGVHC